MSEQNPQEEAEQAGSTSASNESEERPEGSSAPGKGEGQSGSPSASRKNEGQPQPVIHPTARIAKNAVVTGNVEIGADCTVLFNAVLRGDCDGYIEVGDGSNIQEGVCVHVAKGGGTVIGRDVTVGHGAIVHGCTIGDGSLIGMGAIVIDGARVGARCLIGAGALVTGTANIPDGMLVLGSPARAIRALSPEELADLENAAAEYVQVGKDLFAKGLLTKGSAQ